MEDTLKWVDRLLEAIPDQETKVNEFGIKVQSSYYPEQRLDFNEWMEYIFKLLKQPQNENL